MSTPFRFRDLPDELRNRVYRYMSDSGSTCLDLQTTLPNLAYVPDLRAEFLPVYVQQHTVDFDIVYHDDREDVASHLRAYDRSITRNATEVHIYVNDDGSDVNRYTDAALRFTLGRHRVNWSSDSSGASRQGMVHVVFDSLRGSEPVSREHALEIAAGSNKWRRHNTKVAKKIASTINNMLASHGPHLPPRITACELVTLIYLLKDIHGIKLDGFGEGLGMRLDWRMDWRHIMHGAATDFWAMVGRE